MTISASQARAIQDNIYYRLQAAGIEFESCGILPPGAAAPDGTHVFDSQYAGWRVFISATLTEQQITNITAQVAALDATDYVSQVQDELQAAIAALPILMKTGTYADWLAWWNAEPHATAGERATRLETAQLQTWRLLVVIRDMVAAHYRANKLREDEV